MAWMNYKRNNEFFMFEKEGDSIEGRVTGSHTMNTEYGEAVAVDIKQANGAEKTVIQSAGMGDIEKLKGCLVKITYNGMMKNDKTKRWYKSFEVLVDEDDYKVNVQDELPF